MQRQRWWYYIDDRRIQYTRIIYPLLKRERERESDDREPYTNYNTYNTIKVNLIYKILHLFILYSSTVVFERECQWLPKLATSTHDNVVSSASQFDFSIVSTTLRFIPKVVRSSSSCHESCLFYCCVDHSVDIYVGRERERKWYHWKKRENIRNETSIRWYLRSQ